MSANGRSRISDKQFELIIGDILRAGVVLAAVVILLGGILYLHDCAFAPRHYHVFDRAASSAWNLSGIMTNAGHLNGYAIIQLGLLLLVATPVARVLFSVIVFALQKDAVYVTVTLIVLGILLFSLFGRGF